MRLKSLLGYLPGVLREVREYEALAASEDPELSALHDCLDGALNDQFVLAATLNGVQRWEKILQVSPKATYTLAERRFTILARLAEQLPFSVRMLHFMLGELCGATGYTVELDPTAYHLTVKVDLAARSSLDDVTLLLGRVCPCNMVVEVQIRHFEQAECKLFIGAAIACMYMKIKVGVNAYGLG